MEGGAGDYEAQAKAALEVLKTHLQGEEGWNVLSHSHGTNVGAWSRSTEGSNVLVVKARGTVACSAEKLFRHVWDETEDAKKKDDDTLKEDSIVEQLSETSMIRYQAYKTPWPTTDRDLLMLRSYVTEDDGTIYALAVSTEHPDKPETTEHIRARMVIGGYVYKPIGDNETEATYVAQMDPMGNIPAFVVNRSAAKVPKRIAQFQALATSL